MLTLVTDPPGAQVQLCRYETHNRRLVPVFERSLGVTPLREVPLPIGSYLCVIQSEGRPDIRYPVLIERQRDWHGRAPGADTAFPIRLPAVLPEQDQFVPAGWFWSGGDSKARFSLPRKRTWLPALVMRKFPVTNREYLEFLNALVSEGREAEATRWVPRERTGKRMESATMLYGRGEDGRFLLVPDVDGDLWGAEWPVMMIDWPSAVAYAAWYAGRTGLPWRLPHEMEWEKAARGVDGRLFPWGDVADSAWFCAASSFPGRGLPTDVDRWPVDESPYGVRGMAGNVRDWCSNIFSYVGADLDSVEGLPSRESADGRDDQFSVRGGAWNAIWSTARCASRYRAQPNVRFVNYGFRLVRSVPD